MTYHSWHFQILIWSISDLFPFIKFKMRIFGGFCLLAHCDVAAMTCSPGMATGINASGETDSSNTGTCYPTSDSAFVMSCNNLDTGIAEMKVAIEKVSHSLRHNT